MLEEGTESNVHTLPLVKVGRQMKVIMGQSTVERIVQYSTILASLYIYLFI